MSPPRKIPCLFLLCIACAWFLRIAAEKDDKPKVKILAQWVPPECKRKVQPGDAVRYHYYGMLTDGTYFDSSFERGRTYNTQVDSGWLIPGMDQALTGMCINEHRIVSIPAELAYGDEGTGSIPGGATLLFNFILLDISNEDDKVEVSTTYLPPKCDRKLVDTDYVRYHYNGSLLNGDLFHSSYEEDKTYDTYVGQGWLIRGMDKALPGSCMGERRTIIIPPQLGYGAKGDGKNIPPAATLRFDVEIVDFHNPKDTAVSKTLHSRYTSDELEEDNCPRRIENSDFVRYHYNASFVDGTVFDSSYSRNSTYDTYVGLRTLIAGMDWGLVGMCVGDTRKITIPPHLGYGEPGIEDKIPPSAVLVFDVFLVDVHSPKDDVKIEVLVPPPGDCERKAGNEDYLTYEYDLELMDGTKLMSRYEKEVLMLVINYYINSVYTYLHINELFDLSMQKSKDNPGPWGMNLGRGLMVAGLEKALEGMCVGEIRKAVIPPHLGFGEQGSDVVPGSAVLIYTLELKKIDDSLPEGYVLVWKDRSLMPDNIFELVDEDKNQQVDLEELTSYILKEVDAGAARILPGMSREDVVKDLFEARDADKDGILSKSELDGALPQPEEDKVNDEL